MRTKRVTVYRLNIILEVDREFKTYGDAYNYLSRMLKPFKDNEYFKDYIIKNIYKYKKSKVKSGDKK